MAKDPVDRIVWKKLLKRVARKTNDNCDAEDFLHSAFLRLEKYRLGHEVKNDSAFLLHTATNIGIDTFRHNRLATRQIEALEIGDDSPLQDEVLAARARLERVKEGLAHLPPRARKVLLMRRLDGLGYNDIAKRLGISRSTVERIVSHATTFLIEWTKGW